MKKMKFVSWVVGYFFVGMMISNFDPVATVYAQDDNQIQTSAEENPTIYRTVTFDSNGGSEVAPVKVEHAYRVAEPEAPTRPGYTFKGWNKEGSQQAFDFVNEVVTSDITLVAQWEEELLSKENDQSRNDMKKEKNSQKNSPQIISKVETKQLPKTGSINTNTTSFVGLLILGLMSIVIFYRYKKIKIK